MKNFFPLFLAFLCLGCTSDYLLSEEWAPLERISQNGVIAPNHGQHVTIGRTIYVNDLGYFLERDPISIEASLRHERVHSLRQFEYGIYGWLIAYATNPRFRWREEQLAWYEGLKYRLDEGQGINTEKIARTLSSTFYASGLGHMVTYEEAMRWLKAILDNSWSPNEEFVD